MTCSIIDIDVKFYPAGTAITITDPIDGGGNYDPSGLTYLTPPAGSNATVVARAFYHWPLYVTGLGYNIANIGRNTSNSKRLLAATVRLPRRTLRIMPMQKMSLRIRELISGLRRNERGNAAVEFAIIVPIMLTMFFGMVEFSSGIAVNRKVTLVARTLSDLTSQSSR